MSESGLMPVEYKVIVKPDAVETVSRGGIILPGNDRSKWEVQEGVIDALSPHAFTYADWPEGARKPEIGDRVMFAKYGGAEIKRNGVEFRIMNDKDIQAIIPEAVAAKLAA